MRKLSILVMICFALVACSNGVTENNESNADTEKTAGWPRTVKDDYGHEQTLDKKPKRVLVTYFGDIEGMFVLNTPPVASTMAEATMKGFKTLEPYQNHEVIDLGNPATLNMEKILEVNPDLIVVSKKHEDKFDELNKIAPTLVISPADWKDSLRKFASFLGEEETAEKYIKEVDDLLTKSREQMKQFKNKTFVFVDDLGKDKFGAWGSKPTKQFFMFDSKLGLGLQPPKTYPQEWGEISLETLAEMDPDYIFVLGNYSTAENNYQQTFLHEETKQSPVWNSLSAVKNNQVFLLDASIKTGSPLGIKLGVETIVDSLLNGQKEKK